jgi:hypothetical protein
VDGGNGVYHYSAGGGFPDSSYNSGNYWVDVVFSPTAAPYVTSQTPGPNAIGVALGAAVTATFSAPIQGSSLSFTLTDSTGNAVAGTVSYNTTTNTATFAPNAPLVSAMTYKVSLSATDPGGNATIPVTWSFKTYGVWQQSTQADFNSGTFNGTQYDANAGGIVLSNLFADDFTNSTLGSSWIATAWQSGGGANVASSILTVSANEVLSSQTFTDIPIIGKVSFAALPYQHFGLSTDFGSVNGNSWAVFSTGSTSDTLYARVNVNGATTDVSLGALPTGFHVYRVQPMPGAFQFFVDGVLRTTIAAAVPSGTPFKIGMSSYIASSSNLQVDWVKQEGGTFTSSVLNAGQVVNWGTVNWNAITAAGTSVIVEVRTGNVAVPDASWSGWTTVSNGGTISSPSSQYLQYRVRIITNDPAVTAVFENIMVFWS